jgi:hypothetical protein
MMSKKDGQGHRPTGTRNGRSAPISGRGRCSQGQSGPPSQGGDTGSNPVGTTQPNMQVTGQVRADASHERRTPGAIGSREYPAAGQSSSSAPPLKSCRSVPVTSRCISSLTGTRHRRAVSPPARGGDTLPGSHRRCTAALSGAAVVLVDRFIGLGRAGVLAHRPGI